MKEVPSRLAGEGEESGSGLTIFQKNDEKRLKMESFGAEKIG